MCIKGINAYKTIRQHIPLQLSLQLHKCMANNETQNITAHTIVTSLMIVTDTTFSSYNRFEPLSKRNEIPITANLVTHDNKPLKQVTFSYR